MTISSDVVIASNTVQSRGRTVIIFQSKLLEHDFGPSHPFRVKERLIGYVNLLKEKGILSLPWVSLIDPPVKATDDDVLLVHDESLLNLIKYLSKSGGRLDGDTPVPPNTYERALIQVGGLIYAGEAIMHGEFNHAIQCVAFGGHHATRTHVGFSFGFCYFNDDAILARYLQRRGLAKRIAIIDCDAHHGNGIQEAFYDDPTVLYVSMHQDPHTLYPGTGYIDEIGSGEGEGYNINIPLPPKTSNESYLMAIREIFKPIVKEFKPDIILSIIGADTYFADPLTNYAITMECYPLLAQEILDSAKEVCQGRLLVRLGGGYNVQASVYAFYLITACIVGAREIEVRDLYQPPEMDIRVHEEVKRRILKLKNLLSKYWSCF